MAILQFEEALEMARSVKNSRGNPCKVHLLLGNGFSIALKPDIFTYSSLFEKADLTTSPEIVSVFKQLGTTDFEEAVYAMESAASILPCYLPDDPKVRERLRADALKVKNILIETIAGNHPPRPHDVQDDQYQACARFLGNFLGAGKVYTLNYDILLYWTLMHSGVNFDDGFRSDPDDPHADYVYWNDGDSRNQNVYYLHGALHLFDAGHQLRKYTWIRTDDPLIEQARKAISNGDFPLFVSEGMSEKKMTKIEHSGYLHKALRSISNVQGSLFIHGLSLSENDNHILQRIERGKTQKVFVGIYGDPTSHTNAQIIRRAELMPENRTGQELSVHFYDSSSANVWG